MTDRTKEALSAWLDDEASEIEVHQLLRQLKAEASARRDWLGFQHDRALLRGELRGELRGQLGGTLGSKPGGQKQLSRAQHLGLYDSICRAIEQDEPVYGGSLDTSVNAPAEQTVDNTVNNTVNNTVSNTLNTAADGALDKSMLSGGSAQRRHIAQWAKPAGGLALAASLVFGIFLGVQQQMPGSDGIAEVANASAPMTSAPSKSLTGPVTAQTVGAGSSQVAVPQSYESPNRRMRTDGVSGFNSSSDDGNDLFTAQRDNSYDAIDSSLELKALDENKQRQLRAYLREHDQMVRMNPNTRTVIFEPSNSSGH